MKHCSLCGAEISAVNKEPFCHECSVLDDTVQRINCHDELDYITLSDIIACLAYMRSKNLKNIIDIRD